MINHIGIDVEEVARAVELIPKPFYDGRGWFIRAITPAELKALDFQIAEVNLSGNVEAGTLRGLHWQPGQAKIVRCIRGIVADVILDIRPESMTRGRHAIRYLSSANHHALYVPSGCAHGFQAITDRAEVLYLYSTAWVPAQTFGVHYNDPKFGINWPLPVSRISEKDKNWSYT